MDGEITKDDRQEPVTFNRPLNKELANKRKKRNYLITWIVRASAFLAEVLFLLPLCVVSCSSQEDHDKAINGIGVSYGFKLSYLEDPVVGIWWFSFVFVLTAIIIVLWYVKDMNRLKKLKLRRIALCFLTGVLAVLNVVIMCCFIHVANDRVAAANEGFAVGRVTIRYTLGFWILLIIQILLAAGGAFTTTLLYIRKYMIHKSK